MENDAKTMREESTTISLGEIRRYGYVIYIKKDIRIGLEKGYIEAYNIRVTK